MTLLKKMCYIKLNLVADLRLHPTYNLLDADQTIVKIQNFDPHYEQKNVRKLIKL